MIMLIWLQVIGALMTAGAVINATIEVYQTGTLNEAAPSRIGNYIRAKVKTTFRR
jgi:membrane protein